MQLYNYSKEELKEILVEDGIINISKNNSKRDSNSEQNVVEVNMESPDKKPTTAFD